MAILTGDIKLVASQVMLDVPEGGGAPTSNVIVDATSNAIFADISELDRAGGRVNLRKVHVSVQTADTDTYLGCNVIVADPPTDPNVSVTLFSTKEIFDRRDSAKKRLEAYLAPGPSWRGFLFENHIIGQRSIQLFQMPGSTAPEVGHTLLIVQNEGLTSERLQYVRVTRTASALRTFIKDNGQEYKALIVTADLSDALRFDFIGSPPSEFFRRTAASALVRDTTVADAAQYFGVVALTEAVSMGSLSAKAASIFTQLVPSAQTEIPVIDANAAGEYDTVVDASNGNVSITTSIGFSPNVALYFGNPVYPGTLNYRVFGRCTDRCIRGLAAGHHRHWYGGLCARHCHAVTVRSVDRRAARPSPTRPQVRRCSWQTRQGSLFHRKPAPTTTSRPSARRQHRPPRGSATAPTASGTTCVTTVAADWSARMSPTGPGQ